MLGAKIGKPPGLGADYLIVLPVGKAGAVGQHELDVVMHAGIGFLAAHVRKCMVRPGDGNQAHRSDGFAHQTDRAVLERAGDADVGDAIEHMLCHGAERFHMQAEGHGGKRLLKGLEGLHQAVGGQHDVGGQRHLCFEPRCQPPCLGDEAAHASGHDARLRQHGPSGLGELGLSRHVSVEQIEAELGLQIGYGIADHRGRPSELARCGGEAAGFDDGDEDLKLVQRRPGI